MNGPVLVLYSGGRDSTCLLDLAVRTAEPVWGLHVSYGLRGEESDADEAHCRAVCDRLGVELFVLRAGAPAGNVQAWARAVRYAEAERLAAPRDALIAVGHTATDQVETVLYRLATSPGRRALLGMPERAGRIIRPLLGMTREETAAYCRAHGLGWREDTSNASSARGLLRDRVLPALRALHPSAEANILATLATLRDEAEVLDALVDTHVSRLRLPSPAAPGATGAAAAPPGSAGAPRAPAGAGDAPAGAAGASRAPAGAGDAPAAAAGDALAALPPALARLVVQSLAGDVSVAARVDEILALTTRPGTAALDLPGGLRAISEYGVLRFERGRDEPPAPAMLPVPGRVAFGAGEVVCERGAFAIADGTLAARALGDTLEVRPWRSGDRMRPLGLKGTKTLQDLFTDRKVPRERRGTLPVVVSRGEIAWVPGVATGERFRVDAETTDRVRLTWLLDSAAP